MHNWQKYLLSYLLLFSIGAAYVPFDNLHQHHDVACDISNPEVEKNPCHISIYHPTIAQSVQCEHKSHILDEHQHSDICKFIIEKKLKSHAKLKQQRHLVFWNVSKTNFRTDENVFLTETVLSQIYLRGPPA